MRHFFGIVHIKFCVGLLTSPALNVDAPLRNTPVISSNGNTIRIKHNLLYVVVALWAKYHLSEMPKASAFTRGRLSRHHQLR